MSLGVRHLWRFRRHGSLAPRVSFLIPRELPRLARFSPTAAAAPASYSSSRFLSAGGCQGLCDRQESNGETSEQSSGPLGVADSIATETAAEAVFSQRPPGRRIPRMLFFEHLSKLPLATKDIPAPVVVKRPASYSHHREINRDLQQIRKTIIQHNHHSRLAREHVGSQFGDWRRILQKLNEITPRYSLVNGSVQVLVPEESAHLLTDDQQNNIWAIKSRTGCALELHDKNPHDPQDSTYVLLTGERSAIDQAVQDFLDLFQQIKVRHLTLDVAEKLREGDVSPVLSRFHVTVPYQYLSKSLDEIEKPKEWTMVTFEHYILTLIRSRLPAALHYEIGSPSHARHVVLVLLDAFHDPATASALSLTSFKLALRYICSWGDAFWPDAMRLVGFMNSVGFEADSEIYDLLAHMAVKVNKIGLFENLVGQMEENGHRPSLQTWIQFIRLVKDEGIRRYILEAMSSKGLLYHPSAMADLAAELVEHDINRAIQNGLGVESFVASQDRLYGPQWLHWQSSNKVLDVLGGHGRFDDIDRFLTYVFRCPHARPKNEVALNIILTHCKNQRQLDTAVGIVKRFEQEKLVSKRVQEHTGALKTDHITYQLLVDMAWRLKKPHTLSVLIRHSYLLKHTSRRLTLRLFELATIDGAKASGKRIRSFLGRLKITGTLPKPKQGVRDGFYGQREQSDKMLVLAMQNLLLCDYKEAHGIGQDQLLTDEQVELAVQEWYPRTFGDKREDIDKLGNILERALEEDRKNRADSHAGKEIVLEPLSLKKPVRLEEPLESIADTS